LTSRAAPHTVTSVNLRPVVRQVARRGLASGLVAQARQAGRAALSEPDAKTLLAAFEVPVPDGKLATDPGEAVTLAEWLGRASRSWS
jgi:acyl-CoA synthetase (NDP forming)